MGRNDIGGAFVLFHTQITPKLRILCIEGFTVGVLYTAFESGRVAFTEGEWRCIMGQTS